MKKRKSGKIFVLIVYILTLVITMVGATFAYFAANISSDENTIALKAATFAIDLTDDTSLIKTKLIPSAEVYVNMSSYQRLEDGEFIHPYEVDGKIVKDKTACIDDNLNEICSIYTFTIINPMTNSDLPAKVTLRPTVNTFANLYFKVVDSNKNVVMEATRIPGDSKATGIVLDGINVTLPKATKDEKTGEIVPSTATYSIILWINETGKDQTKEDGKQIFAGGIQVNSIDSSGNGITGVFSVGGVESY